jgi:hypothetical protein
MPDAYLAQFDTSTVFADEILEKFAKINTSRSGEVENDLGGIEIDFDINKLHIKRAGAYGFLAKTPRAPGKFVIGRGGGFVRIRSGPENAYCGTGAAAGQKVVQTDDLAEMQALFRFHHKTLADNGGIRHGIAIERRAAVAYANSYYGHDMRGRSGWLQSFMI